jgi:diaminohydroxyphosphoribosylaminopyrimidine deaminase/5-amino-6-(5-phosphoribosylamino)uracil reductase
VARRRFHSPFAFLLEGSASDAVADVARDDDDRFLALALDEANRGVGRTHPNPPVGCVVVRDGLVVAKGHHRAVGKAHAEVEALDRAGDHALGSTVYVTLEPCTHHGRTPPCVDRILQEGVARVVVGARDPNPEVRGKGIARLRRAGVEVLLMTRGPVAARCRALIAPFASVMERDRPWVVAKVAATLDGRVATKSGDAKWVTGEPARALVHTLRDRADAVLVGAGTVRADDPALTVRHGHKRSRDPARVVIDGGLVTSPKARVYAPGGPRTLVMHTRGASERKARAFDRAGVERRVVAGRGGHTNLARALEALVEEGVTSVLVEPGPGLLTALLAADLVDELWWFTAPALVGADGRESLGARRLSRMADALRFVGGASLHIVGDDVLRVGAPGVAR